ncbi:MAG: DUF3105 domain-containing protein [Sporichthyaceae bacterium]
MKGIETMPNTKESAGAESGRPSNAGGTRKAAARSRAEKVDALRRTQDRRRRLRSGAIAMAVVLAVGGAATFVAVAVKQDMDSDAALGGPIAELQEFTPEAAHVPTPVEYAQTPPAGGDHNSAWLNCGVYAEEVTAENAVHSMEHGAVWITYRADLPSDGVQDLKEQLPDSYAILSPFEGLSAPVVASGWGRQVALDSPSDPRLTQFIEQFRLGTNAPEPGAPCDGGVDATGPLAAAPAQ